MASESAMREPPMSRAATLTAHSLPGLIIGFVVARIGAFLHVPYASGLAHLIPFMVAAGVIALVFHLRKGALCLRCIRSSPLNPQRAVERNKVFLYVAHWPRKKWWIVWSACLSGTIAADFFTGVVNDLLKTPMDVFFLVVMWGIWAHHRLAPWCPYCRGWDEGGEEELVPDPDPSEKATR
jgi:hypothetical protein